MSKTSSLRVPSYRRHKPTNQAVVTINGQDIYLGRWNSAASKAEYDRIVSEWLSVGRSLSFGALSEGVTVSELLLAYLKYAKAYYPAGRRGEYANMKLAVRPLRRLYGKTLAADFGPAQYKAVRLTLIESECSRS